MKKYVGLFAQGIGLGMGIGLCLAGAAGLLYHAVHSADTNHDFGHVTLYLFVVGGLMGFIGGWCFSLQMIVGGLLSTLFMKISQLVPIPAAVVGEEWAKRMETFFREVLAPFPGFFKKFAEYFFILRFEDYGRINRAIEKAKRKSPDPSFSPLWMSQVILHYLLEPLWLFFYAAYVILFIAGCIFWSFAFIG